MVCLANWSSAAILRSLNSLRREVFSARSSDALLRASCSTWMICSSAPAISAPVWAIEA
jgi:hypothetical protein